MKKKWRKLVAWVMVFCVFMSVKNVTAFAATDLKLNADTLRKIRDEGWSDEIRADELFLGIGEEGFNYNDVSKCLSNYGIEYYRDMSEISYGFGMYYFYFGFSDMSVYDTVNNYEMNHEFQNEDWWWDGLYQDLSKITFSGNTMIDMNFHSNYYDESAGGFLLYDPSVIDAFIAQIEAINSVNQ